MHNWVQWWAESQYKQIKVQINAIPSFGNGLRLGTWRVRAGTATHNFGLIKERMGAAGAWGPTSRASQESSSSMPVVSALTSFDE